MRIIMRQQGIKAGKKLQKIIFWPFLQYIMESVTVSLPNCSVCNKPDAGYVDESVHYCKDCMVASIFGDDHPTVRAHPSYPGLMSNAASILEISKNKTKAIAFLKSHKRPVQTSTLTLVLRPQLRSGRVAKPIRERKRLGSCIWCTAECIEEFPGTIFDYRRHRKAVRPVLCMECRSHFSAMIRRCKTCACYYNVLDNYGTRAIEILDADNARACPSCVMKMPRSPEQTRELYFPYHTQEKVKARCEKLFEKERDFYAY